MPHQSKCHHYPGLLALYSGRYSAWPDQSLTVSSGVRRRLAGVRRRLAFEPDGIGATCQITDESGHR
jgi:hypothetical protein